MLEAFWLAEFKSTLNISGCGVAVIDNGQIYGGDFMFMYRGSLAVEGETVKAKLDVIKHSNLPGMVSLTGADRFKLELIGKKDFNVVDMHGQADNGVGIHIQLTRKAEL